MSTVTLSRPIKRGDTEITSLELTEPNAGSLRGVRLTDLLNGDIDAVVTVLPRITKNAIQQHEIVQMSARDLASVTEAIITFFMVADPAEQTGPIQSGPTESEQMESELLPASSDEQG